ncbi:MAG: HPr family phosphocarrier protein [Selenomonadaceae bacterium]|nr:HPr family phosphocarrier protein [Selenomonadaceae bacterium]MBR1579536.1 HPr family phosphocarrier protein [Selenomonadaceae bacterium]
MAFAYKVIDNRNYDESVAVDKIEAMDIDKYIDSDAELEKYGAVVSFILVAKGVLGLRECSHLVSIAEETGCLIRLISGKRSGSTKSILSLANLGITKGKSLVLSIHGARSKEAFREAVKVINGETDSNDA